MYIGYLSDRQELGFSCTNDIHAVQQLSDFKSTLKNPVTWIITKGKKTVILIVSKEVLVAVFIFIESSYIKPNVDWSSFSSSEVSQSCVSRSSDTSVFLTSPSHIQDYILKLKGGFDESELNGEQKLKNSILAIIPESDLDDISINKRLQRLGEIIYSVISNQNLWRILSELEKPLKPQLSGWNPISDIVGTAQNVQDKEPKSKGSSSIFAEALNIPNTRKLSPMQKRVQLKMAKKENNFSNKLESSGLSRNREELSENIQFIEKLTRLRRAQPLYPSQVMGDSYQYGGKQLERKAPRHLEHFGISAEGKTVEEMAMEYKELVESLLSKSNLVIREDGRLNKQEPTINIGDPESRGVVSFENNPLYEDHHFITSYPISEEAFETFEETGNIGSSPEERAQEINELQRTRAQAERERTTASLFYSSLPEDARIGNQQLREVETIQEQLKENTSFSLTEKQKDLIQRAEKYKQHKNKFSQNNPDIDKGEF